MQLDIPYNLRTLPNRMTKKLNDFYFLPFTIIFALPLLFYAFDNEGSRNYIAFLSTIIIPIVLRIVFNIKPFIFVLLSLPILVLAIIYDVMVFDFGSYINMGSWNSIFNTNVNEAKELTSDTRLATKVMMGIHILVYLVYLFFTKGKQMHMVKSKIKYIAIVLLLFFVVDYSLKGATRIVFPVRSTTSFLEYFQVKSKEAEYFEAKLHTDFQSKRAINNTNKETIVVVLGESLRRDHLEYYGYNKPTTPLLKKEDLICYSDVISPANQSINSIKRIFSLAEFNNEAPYWKLPSFIKSFKEVGFKTYWISTQKIYGKYESEISFLAKESDSIVFKSPMGHDEALFEPYQQLLKNDDVKKLIFIHVMGSHAKYNKRYPKEYAFFKNVDDEKENLVNEYDNSVRYNDYILNHFLNKLKKQHGENTFLMFSDHGESLFDSGKNILQHGCVKPAKSEFEVPLVLWFSDLFKENHPNKFRSVIANKDKSIILSDFFHALPPLFHIKFSKLNPENNFFGSLYKEKKNRKVINGAGELLNYNTLKKINVTTNSSK